LNTPHDKDAICTTLGSRGTSILKKITFDYRCFCSKGSKEKLKEFKQKHEIIFKKYLIIDSFYTNDIDLCDGPIVLSPTNIEGLFLLKY